MTSTLFGHHAVHTLDGDDHRVRKAMFMSLASREGVADLVAHATAEWDRAVLRWTAQPGVVLFDEASRVLTAAVGKWAGILLRADEVDGLAADLVAMVDGFATPGIRHVRARRARARREAWLTNLVSDVRIGAVTVPAGSAVDVVAPNATRLLRRLGVLDVLVRHAVRLDVGWEFRRWQDGTILSAENLATACERLHGEHTYTVHRADLLDVLRQAVPARMTKPLRGRAGMRRSEIVRSCSGTS